MQLDSTISNLNSTAEQIMKNQNNNNHLQLRIKNLNNTNSKQKKTTRESKTHSLSKTDNSLIPCMKSSRTTFRSTVYGIFALSLVLIQRLLAVISKCNTLDILRTCRTNGKMGNIIKMKCLQITAGNKDKAINLSKIIEMLDKITIKARIIITIIDQTKTTTTIAAMKDKTKGLTGLTKRIQTTEVIHIRTTSTNGSMINQNKKTQMNPKHNRTQTTLQSKFNMQKFHNNKEVNTSHVNNIQILLLRELKTEMHSKHRMILSM